MATASTARWPSMFSVLISPWRQHPRSTPPTSSSSVSGLSSLSISGLSSRQSFRHYSKLANRSPIRQTSRQFSSLTRQLSFKPQSLYRPASLAFTQQRTLFASNPNASNSLLSHLEATANNNPQSATAQNAFYNALLRANMPEILVDRYNTKRFATSPACEQLYMRALERVAVAETGATSQTSAFANGNGMTAEQLQAVTQAVGARTAGGNIAVSRQGSGLKKEPLYVVVDESVGSMIFKWVKFLLSLVLWTYIALVVLSLVIEATGMIKKVGPGGSKNAEVKPELQKTRFSDVHGCEEAKEELLELVEFLKDPTKFATLGGKLPKGVLLSGPPGTGKTLLARAVAGEAQVPFFYMSGSEFDEIYVGVGAKRVRDLFSGARGKAPAIIFIDELDAIGGKRSARDASYAKQTLNQLLTELDGFDQDTGVVIIGATNFPQSLDPALTRPGRFDRNVNVGLPDVRGRIAIINHHLQKIRVETEVDASLLARGTPGFSGADLENIVNQAAVHASKNKAKKVSMKDLIWAKDKLLMGAERRSAVIQQKDKVMTAYHEGGHALVAMLTKGSTPLYKATIMPRGDSLGHTQMLPELDQVSQSKMELMASIDVSMGGKVAEELIYGPDNVTTGCSSDLQNATKVAYIMVTMAGMSEKLGNVDLNSNSNRLSSQTKEMIESEVRRLLEEGRERATKLLTTNRVQLERLANALVEYETLDKAEMEAVVRGEKLTDKIKSAIDAPVKIPEMPMPPSVGLPPSTGFPPLLGGGPKSGPAGAPPGPKPYPTGSP